ncbi:carbohydrate-binding domain-containing protein [Mucilaginibacter antarcticus]|uniref:carbohydrate-binding domain-containing protein n=1 Tax=Mucilaginibacter antarcticus TaxID=1855725 RepID=UPI00363BB0F7
MKNQFTFLRKAAAPILVAIVLCFTACSKKNDVPKDPLNNVATTKVDSAAVTKGPTEGSSEAGANVDDLIAGSTFPTIITVSFNATGATVVPATTGITVTQTGGDVVINSTATDVAYMVTGTTANGSLKIYSDKKYLLTLNAANITNLDGPAINLQSSKRAFVNIADGSVNTLVDGAIYTAFAKEDQKGTFFSEGQVVFGGTGTLNIVGNNKHGIAADDYVRVISGTINITKTISDGIHTNSAFIADGGTVKIVSGTDGIETEKGKIIINAGNINITSGAKV